MFSKRRRGSPCIESLQSSSSRHCRSAGISSHACDVAMGFKIMLSPGASGSPDIDRSTVSTGLSGQVKIFKSRDDIIHAVGLYKRLKAYKSSVWFVYCSNTISSCRSQFNIYLLPSTHRGPWVWSFSPVLAENNIALHCDKV